MKREAKFTSLYDLHITFTFLCYFSAMKAGFDCMGQVNCFVRKGTGTILSPLPPLNLGKCLAEGEVTVKIASIIKIDIWFESRTPPLGTAATMGVGSIALANIFTSHRRQCEVKNLY